MTMKRLLAEHPDVRKAAQEVADRYDAATRAASEANRIWQEGGAGTDALRDADEAAQAAQRAYGIACHDFDRIVLRAHLVTPRRARDEGGAETGDPKTN